MKQRNSLLFLILFPISFLALLVCGMGGCGNADDLNAEKENSSQGKVQLNYEVEWLVLNPAPSMDAGILVTPVLAGQTLYYISTGGEGEKQEYTLHGRNLLNGEEWNALLELSESFVLTGYDVDVQGNRYFCITDTSLRKEYPEAEARKLLIKQDAGGAEVYRTEVPTEHCGLLAAPHADAQGKVYFPRTDDYAVYNEKGEYEGTVPWVPWEEIEAAALGESNPLPQISWANYDILEESVKQVERLEEDKLAVVIADYDKNCYEAAIMTPVSQEQPSGRIELVLGVLADNTMISRAVVDFNKSQDEIRVKIKAYQGEDSSLTREEAELALSADILAGNGPDIVAISPGMDWRPLAQAGMLEDLTPYVETSTVLQKQDFLEHMWDAYVYDGKLAAVPAEFTLQTVAGKQALLGEEAGMTVEELLELFREHPQSQLLERASRETVLHLCWAFVQRDCIDWEKRTCNFTSQELAEMMAFVSTFPSDSDAFTVEDTDRFASGRVLLRETELLNAEAYLQVFRDFGMEPVTFTGYPTASGAPGHFLYPCNEVYGIAFQSAHKEAAWKFIESYHSWKQKQNYMVGFSAVTERLRAQLAAAYEDAEMETAGAFRDFTEEELTEQFLEMAEAAAMEQARDSQINAILSEEVMPFLKGDKTWEETAQIMQNRVSVYLEE